VRALLVNSAPRALPAGRKSRRGRRARLVVAGAFAGFLLAELVTRIATGTLATWGSPDDRRISVVDPLVGRVPRPGLTGRHPKGFTIHIDDDGTRSNGGTAVAPRPSTLVLGDSFAFGDEVHDDESWPAQLEQRRRRRVLNAGVPGFGLDQSVLRARELAATFAPDDIVLAFIPHDVRRCEMSFWSGNAKPWFDIDDGKLRYHPAIVAEHRLGFLTDALSHSVVVDRLFSRSLHWDGANTVVHHQGREVACLLMEDLGTLGRERGVRIHVVAHPQAPSTPDDDRDLAAAVLECAGRAGVGVLDLFPTFDAMAPDQRAALYTRHLTPEGNRLVAAAVADLLDRTGGPPAH
jgi:hypothetical protein